MPPVLVESASFRDPSSTVFYADGRVFRGLTAAATANWEAVAQCRFFRRLLDEGRVVPTRAVSTDGARQLGRDAAWSLVLEHERIPFVSYPYEWTFSMLQDAAVLHLEILLEALVEKVTLKDGYAFNVQWKGAQPLFIDIPSFEPVRGGGPWAGYRQFCQTFLFPLMLQAHKGVSFQPLLRAQVDGLEPDQMRRLFTGFSRVRRGVFRHVYLQSVMEHRFARASTNAVSAELRSAGFDEELTRALVGKLLKLVRSLEWKEKSSTWSDYGGTCSYSDEDRHAKLSFVRSALGATRRSVVWDLGCNDGTYSRLAAQHADLVVAVDGDDLVVDRFYRALRDEGTTGILPLVMNLLNPSPGLGWRGLERKAFGDRGQPEVVLALALLHHLAIAGNVPLAEIVRWLRSFDAEAVVEFVDRHDPMAARLLANKPAEIHAGYDLDVFEPLLSKSFDIVGSTRLPSGSRSLFHVVPRG